VLLHHLTQAGVPLGKPAIKLGNSHPEVLVVKHLKYDFTFSEIKIYYSKISLFGRTRGAIVGK
jgi:hypothetical protein